MKFNPTIEIHYKATEDLINSYVNNFNEQMKRQNPDDWRSKTIKCSTVRLMNILVKMLAAHFKKCEASKHWDNPFRTNNVALAGKMCQSPSTIWRHLNRLQKIGFLLSKKFRGTNTSYELVFDLKLIVLKQGQTAESFVRNMLANPELGPLMQPEGATGANFATNVANSLRLQDWGRLATSGVLAKCNHTEIAGNPKGENNNMEIKGVVHIGAIVKTIAPQNNSGALGRTGTVALEQTSKGNGKAVGEKMPDSALLMRLETFLRRAGGGGAWDKLDSERRALLFFYAQRIFMVAQSALNPNKACTERAQMQTYTHILLFFLKTPDAYAKRFDEYCQRILLAKHYLRKYPEFIPQPLEVWTNPENPKGFRGTKDWYEKTLIKRKENKDYYLNITVFAKAFRLYVNNPTAHNYQVSTQMLGKRNGGALMDLFNKSILAHNLKTLATNGTK